MSIETQNSHKPVIGITMGDPTGIGPEIIVKSLSRERIYDLCKPLILGDARIVSRAAKLLKIPLKVNIVEDPTQGRYIYGELDIMDLSQLNPETIFYGKPDYQSGRAMAIYIETGFYLAQEKKISALVTAPINKDAINKAGFPYKGHTDFLAHLAGTKEAVMMFASKEMKIALVTIHVPIAKVSQELTQEKIFTTIKIFFEGLQKFFGISDPNLAVAALNPHAGEGGLIGKEELEIIIPALEKAKDMGINVHGPYPADTLFYPDKKKQFDAIVCMYHDQGLIPLKMVSFKESVNITLGLPIIRTSVDHGTAYDLAGKGIGDSSSLIAAIEMATHMAKMAKRNTQIFTHGQKPTFSQLPLELRGLHCHKKEENK